MSPCPLYSGRERSGGVVAAPANGRYLNNMAATQAIRRGGGSMSVIGAARTALLLARDPREEAIRILASTNPEQRSRG